MALVVYDRVQETTATTGTGTLTLSGAVAGYQSFAVVGNGNTTFYTILNGSQWEVGIGTYSTTGPTLARTTILSNSNGNTTPITLSGASSVWCDYPAEKSVNLDASGNVSALGTIASGTWQGTTIAVSYGGTGVTTSSGVNSVVLRDASQNVTANNFIASYNVITAAGGTTVLTVASAYYQRISGSTTQTIQLPNATTLVNGQGFTFDNDSSGTVTIVDNASTTIDTVPSGAYSYIFVEDNSTSAGSWGKYALIPASYDFSTSTANFGNATITNATYNGNTITPAYGGTGLTTFTAANNALYSSGATTLTAGTLPVAAGGTGATTLTSNGVLYGTGTTAVGATSAGTTGQILIATTGSAPSWGSVPTTAAVTSFSAGTTGFTPSSATTGAITLAGTLATSNGGTGLTSFTANGAVYASSTSALTTGTLPIASGGTNSTATPTAGGVGYGTGTAHAYTTAGTSGQALISAGASAPSFGTLGIGGGGTGQTTASAAFNALSPITTLGDIIYGSATNTSSRLAGNTTSTKNFLVQTGTGTVSAAPAWGTIAAADVPTLNQNTTGSAGSVANALTIGTGLSGTSYNGSAAVTIANSGVTSAVAGTGISVSGATGAVTITNSGVTSAVAGTGVSVSGATGAVTVSIGQAVATSSNVQFNSLGVGTAGSATAGEIRATNNITGFYSSDRQFKENVQDIQNATQIASSIGGKTFDWTDAYLEAHGGEDGYFYQKADFGVIAQDVQAVFPQAVRTRENGTLAVDYAKLSALALAAIAELTKRIEVLEAK